MNRHFGRATLCGLAALAAVACADEKKPPGGSVPQLVPAKDFARMDEVLGAKLNAKQRALLHLALSFHTWRALVQETGMKPAAAVEAMVSYT